jgi:GAF domain-containing protein
VPTSAVFDMLAREARELVVALDASACAVSRALGDVLVMVAEYVGERATLQIGAGYLISDYPLTKEALERRESRTISLDDPGADPDEAALLRELDYRALVMLPLLAHGQVWGLVEVYRDDDRPFSPAEVARAEERVRVLAEELESMLG